MASIPKNILAVMACPTCRGDLKEGKESLSCTKCKAIYPIKNGIAMMMPKKDTGKER
ncbi:Trm112 family protein [Candidatus Woesearchaeota archaeon]|nr:Trm112 family protein [Candidatus Woesearchaeota archaeon]HIH38275.1 Trm112 family protein [Candidatus Woesearchaeota archaeon]HIH49151.1 Trm112 family protein [Candidatus Woesearchaeota archaeon]HIJ04431.1 Trm112 family protein [Candidatus Woesearchaeota archaeon]